MIQFGPAVPIIICLFILLNFHNKNGPMVSTISNNDTMKPNFAQILYYDIRGKRLKSRSCLHDKAFELGPLTSYYSTVTDFARFLGLSTSRPLATLT